MNNKFKITIGAVAATAVLGLGISQSSAAQVDPKLSTDEIRDLVGAFVNLAPNEMPSNSLLFP